MSLVKSNKLRFIRFHTWLIASLTLVAHTALIDDDFREVSVNLVPAMVSVAMQTRPYCLRHRSFLSLFPRRTMSLGTHGGALSRPNEVRPVGV